MSSGFSEKRTLFHFFGNFPRQKRQEFKALVPVVTKRK
jgi:hypothetical protein